MYCTFGSTFFNKYHCNYSISEGNAGSFVYVISTKDWFCESVEWYVSTFWVEQFWHRHGSCVSIQTSWLWQEVVQLLKQCRICLVIYFILGMYELLVHAPYVCHRTMQRVVTAWWLLVSSLKSPSAIQQDWTGHVRLCLKAFPSPSFLPVICSKIFCSPSIIIHMQQHGSSLAPCQYVMQKCEFIHKGKDTKIVNQIT